MPGSVQAWIPGRGRRDGIYQVKQEQKVTRPRIENKCRSTNCYFKAKEKPATQAASIFKCHRSVAWGDRADLGLLVLSAEDAVFPQRQRDFTDAITAGHWGSGLHVGKHVLSNPGKRLLWQPSRQSVALILEKAKAAETEVVSNNNTTIRASELFTLVTLGRWCAGAQSHQAIRVLSGCCPWDPGLWKMQQAGLDFPVSRVQLQILIRF